MTTDHSSTPPSRRGIARSLLSVMGALIAVRVYYQVLVDRGVRSRLWLAEHRWAILLLFVTAACLAWFAARLTQRRLGRRLVIPMAAVTGALVTAFWSSLAGTAVGAAAGVLALSGPVQRMLLTAGRSAFTLLVPAWLGGAVAGGILVRASHSEPGWERLLAWAIGGLLAMAACGFLGQSLWRRAQEQRALHEPSAAEHHWTWRTGWLIRLAAILSCTFGAFAVGAWSGRELELLWRGWRLSQVGTVFYDRRPTSVAWRDGRLFLGIVELDEQALDSHLALLRGSPDLAVLLLRSPHVTNEGLRHIAGLHGLRILEVNDAPITDEGLESLRPLNSLYTLGLRHTQATRASISLLAALPSLTHLRLEGVRGVGSLAALKSSQRITQLELTNCDVRDDELQDIACANLQYLVLAQNQLTGAGLPRLLDSARLDRIDLSQNPLVTGNLHHLAKIQPSYLLLDGVPLDATGIQALHRQRRLQVLAIRDCAAPRRELYALVNRLRLHELIVDDAPVEIDASAKGQIQFLSLHVRQQRLEQDAIQRLIETDGDVTLHRCQLTPGAIAEILRSSHHQFTLERCELDSRFRELLREHVIWSEEKTP